MAPNLRGANRTKLGLKCHNWAVAPAIILCANRTKLGLKSPLTLAAKLWVLSANRTKLGLKSGQSWQVALTEARQSNQAGIEICAIDAWMLAPLTAPIEPSWD